jgi:hypothetical protein
LADGDSSTLPVRMLLPVDGEFASCASFLTTRSGREPAAALVIEILLTAVLMFVIVWFATDTRAVGELAAVPIGGHGRADALWAGSIHNGGFDEPNPARSFGPLLALSLRRRASLQPPEINHWPCPWSEPSETPPRLRIPAPRSASPRRHRDYRARLGGLSARRGFSPRSCSKPY